MQKNYIVTALFVFMSMISQQGFSQGFNDNMPSHENIEGLSVFPNPVQNGKQFIYITSKQNLTKRVEIFNVLGKQVFSNILVGKELNISRLSSGVYVLRITENKISETRKLVIK